MILLLEDEAELSRVICTTLEQEFEILAVTTAEQARELLQSHRFAALVCDHNLPGPMQGLDFLIEAIKVQPEARRILLTGFINPEVLANVETVARLSACLVKPLHIARLRQALRDALGTHQE
ncbi:MAG: response regulator [Opitutae bacterium]|nr:response regulator [Opitutae bacterium]